MIPSKITAKTISQITTDDLRSMTQEQLLAVTKKGLTLAKSNITRIAKAGYPSPAGAYLQREGALQKPDTLNRNQLIHSAKLLIEFRGRKTSTVKGARKSFEDFQKTVQKAAGRSIELDKKGWTKIWNTVDKVKDMASALVNNIGSPTARDTAIKQYSDLKNKHITQRMKIALNDKLKDYHLQHFVYSDPSKMSREQYIASEYALQLWEKDQGLPSSIREIRGK